MVGRREAAAVEEVAMISRTEQDFKRSDTNRSFTQGWFISDSHSDDEEQEEEEEEEEQQDDEVLSVAGEIAELPILKQVRTALLRVEDQKQQKQQLRVTDVSGLTRIQRKAIVDRLLDHGDEANEALLKGIKKRCDKVGIKVPKVEVRFRDLTVSAKCYAGDRALPTLWNVTRNAIEGFLSIVGISPTTKMDLNILSDTTGIIKPSRLTLLLGPPSSGKTTMLLALAGKLDPTLKVDGQIMYNGHELGEFVPPKTSAYISQTDLHLGEKTVRETLEFSARCQGVGLKAETLKEILRREKATGVTPNVDIDLFMKATAVDGVPSSLQTDYILKVLGLDKCADTFVGDGMIRGVSGGERKRVTTGELLVGPSRVLFMDEISTGLDSSTTYQIVKTLGHFAHHGEATILMSLLQPAPETFELFDDVILLSEGQIVYQGPRDHILDFFESCGFKCPERKGAADFLQEVTSRKDQEQYWFDKTKPYKYIAVKQFSDKFQQFHVGKTLKNEMLAPFNKKGKDKAALAHSKISVNRAELFRTNLASEILLIKRNSFVYIFRLFQIIVMAFIAETVYLRTLMHQRTLDDANLYLGAMFFSLVLHVFNGYPEVAFIIVRLPVFFKQRDLLLYPAWTFTLPTFLVRLPISLLEAGVWVIMTYYVIGYAPEPSRFFRQILVLFLLHQMSTSLFRFIGALSRSMVKANAGGSLALLVFFMLGGFILHKDQIPKWWMWGYWISPLTYAQNAISINELLAPRWNKPSGINGTSLGKLALISNGYSTEDYWYWIGAGALAVYTIIANVLFTITLSYINPPGRTQAVVSKEMLAEIQSTQESHENEKGVTIQPSSEERNRGGAGDIQIPAVNSHRTWTVSCAKVDVEAAISAPQRKAILPFHPLTMSFENVNYSVDMPPEMRELNPVDTRLQLLHNVTGAFRPGVLTALMGVSGAGKTTLMDVLAGRKTGGYIEGDICISGYPKKQETFARISGYCEQTDIHSPQVTVYESLLFSAWLRLSPDVTSEYKLAFVEEIMELVELDSIRDSLVGLPGATGLSTEQRKRLTIAVELVANPSIIFMDEPTSGLDARAAAIVMRTVRNTVDTGRTVVCTIHQPSIDIFESFDELLLMKQGGHAIYAGPLGQRSAKVIEYFEAIPGVMKIRDGYNPAAWMLDVTSASEEIRVGVDFSHVYENSSLYQQNQAIVKELGKIQPASKDLSFATQYSQSFFQQIKCCLWKQWWTYWRSPGYNCVRFLYSFVCAVLLGTIFWKLGARRKTEQDLLSVLGALYGASMFMGVSNCSSVQPVVDVERTVFYRERAAGMYSAMPYAIAQVLIEIPYTLVQTLVYGLIVYGLIGFPWRADKVFWFLFVMFFTFLYFTYYGMMAVAISPNHQIAAIIASTFYSFFNLFSGFFIPKPSIPIWWSWYYWICPVAWTVYGAVTSQFGDVTDLIELPGRNATQINTYLEEHLGYHHDFLGIVAAVLVGFTVFFALMYAYCIKHLNFQHR